MQIVPFLKLIRLPNVFTAACNSLAGAFCVGIGFDRWRDLTLLALASMSLYAAGILLNDLFDLDEDRRDRPQRPLPSGVVPVRLAAAFACLLSLAGCLAAAAISPQVGCVALFLLSAVVGYDGALKRTFAGPWVMGLCRGLNLALGLAIAPLQIWAFCAIAGYTVYIAGITYISRLETHVGQTKGLSLGFTLILAGIGAVLTGIFLKTNIHREILSQSSATEFPALLGIFLLIILIKLLANAWQGAMRDPKPATIQNVVKTGIISLPLIDLSLTISLAGLLQASPILALWLMARLTARKLYTT